jgi:hypothetical protein
MCNYRAMRGAQQANKAGGKISGRARWDGWSSILLGVAWEVLCTKVMLSRKPTDKEIALWLRAGPRCPLTPVYSS